MADDDMADSLAFFEAVLDSVPQHLVIIDRDGLIHYVNSAWVDFGTENGCVMSSGWSGVNYLHVCEASARRGERDAGVVLTGASRVMSGEVAEFYHEYPCHSPSEKRFFLMRVTPLRWSGRPAFIISHENITERKLAEDAVTEMARLDGLTGVANRRRFDECLDEEWRRAARVRSPISLLMVDVDEFKHFNDGYGHEAGDRCLRRIAESLKASLRRPGDLCARYGGEEFGLLLADATGSGAAIVAQRLLDRVRGLQIAHAFSTTAPIVTVSVGVASVWPPRDSTDRPLVHMADRALYTAKRRGRNQYATLEP